LEDVSKLLYFNLAQVGADVLTEKGPRLEYRKVSRAYISCATLMALSSDFDITELRLAMEELVLIPEPYCPMSLRTQKESWSWIALANFS